MNKAQRLDSEEWVEGYLLNPTTIGEVGEILSYYTTIKPETLQVQITSTGEWVNVEDTEVVDKKKFEKCIGCIYIACENHKECLYGV